MKKIANVFILVACFLVLGSWEDHPDVRDFSAEDRHFRDMQEKTGCDHHDRATVNPERDSHSGDYSSKDGYREGTFGPPDRDK